MLFDPANSCQGHQEAHARLIRIPHPPLRCLLSMTDAPIGSLFFKGLPIFLSLLMPLREAAQEAKRPAHWD